MSHEIDFTTGRAAIAYVGDAPWHRLGSQLSPGQGLDVWRIEAGLDYEVVKAPVSYVGLFDKNCAFPGRHVLYRDDTGAPLSIVSSGYNVVQPSEVLDFFGHLSDIGGFQMEVAGALSGGKRVWGLARVSDGACVIGQDEIRPYVLFATSYDGTMATVAKFTAVRVVCNNTITMAVGRGIGQVGKTEADTQDRAVSSLVRIPHSRAIDIQDIRLKLGLVSNAFERFLVETRLMAEKPMETATAKDFLANLLHNINPDKKVEETKSYRRMLALFEGDEVGSALTGHRSYWQMLNAVTAYTDHEMCQTSDARLNSAWFGKGEVIKNKAFEMLTGEVCDG